MKVYKRLNGLEDMIARGGVRLLVIKLEHIVSIENITLEMAGHYTCWVNETLARVNVLVIPNIGMDASTTSTRRPETTTERPQEERWYNLKNIIAKSLTLLSLLF